MISRVLPVPKRIDLIVIGCAVTLAALGVLFVASATATGRQTGLATRQAIWIGAGLALMFAAVLVAHLFENEDDGKLRMPAFFKLGAIVMIPFLLTFLQPDLGLALTMLPLLAIGFFFGGMPLKGWIVIILVLCLLAGGAWFFLKDYQKQRIANFFNPEQDLLKSGYQVQQSKIAVGSGGFSGKGFRSGTQSQLRFLPVQHTDFIFAVIAEEWGFLGVILILALFAALVLRGLALARVARDRGGVFLILGLIGMIFFSVMVNTSMMIGLLPTTGIPLPLVSYGGSSIATTFIAVGLILGVEYRRFANA